jgi:GT2 family glycosyltransferase
MTAITVLIACRNGEDTLEETLAGIASQVWEQPWEVILADNGSTDRSVAIFERFAERHPWLAMRVVDASKEPGKSFALNVGVASAAGRAFILNDADDVMGPGYLATLGQALEKADLVGGGNEFTRLNPEWIFEVWPVREIRERRPTPFPPHLPFVGGCCMGFTRALFDAVGGFDKSYEAEEDLDFFFRAQIAGYAFEYLPEATMHYRRRTDPAAIRRQFYNYGRFHVKIAREYARWGPPAPRRWRRFIGGWVRVLGMAGLALARRDATPASLAKLSCNYGWSLGQLVGVLEFRAPPT